MVCSKTLAASITAAAVALAEGKTDDEIGLLGTVLTQLGDTLQTIAAQNQAIENKNENKKDDNKEQEKIEEKNKNKSSA